MIFFFECGRLGNQLFQHHGIRNYFPNHRIVYFGFESLASTVEPIDATIVHRRDLLDSNRLYRLIRYLLTNLAKWRIIGRISEGQHVDSHTVDVRNGLIPKIYFFEPAYFQHKNLLNEPPIFKLKADMASEALEWLNRKGLDPNIHEFVFVHVRRGDYIRWPSSHAPAVLELDWYRRAIDQARKAIEKPIFIILTDDPFYVRDVFEESDDMVFSDNTPTVDLAIMGMCRHGILSSSSFALCGAWMSRTRIAPYRDTAQLYIAPKYWIGRRTKEWFPEGIDAPWITFVD
jgi:hypothetical protein